MIFVNGLIVGFLLGASAFGVLAILMISHKRPAPPPTMYRRKNRDRPLPYVPPPWERTEVGGIDYRFLGQTGHESD